MGVDSSSCMRLVIAGAGQWTHIKGHPNSIQLGEEVTITAAEKQVGPGWAEEL